MRRILCKVFGHNDTPLGSQVNDGPFVLAAVYCKRCHRMTLVPERHR